MAGPGQQQLEQVNTHICSALLGRLQCGLHGTCSGHVHRLLHLLIQKNGRIGVGGRGGRGQGGLQGRGGRGGGGKQQPRIGNFIILFSILKLFCG